MSKMSATNIQITPGDNRPIFKQIVDGLRLQIASGELAVGSKLPSVRGLALQLTINPNTVAKAYGELTNQGLLEARQGLGLFVSEPKQRYSKEEQHKRLETAVSALVNEVVYLDYSREDVIEAVRQALNKIEPKG